jgi:two-component system LytT family response regulator
MSRINCILVDDEPLCRQDLKDALQNFPEIQILGEAENKKQAQFLLRKNKVQLMFLDLSLGNEFGFDLLRRSTFAGAVIAVTAHPSYAVEGFEHDLTDYLLKPVKKERLRESLIRARRKIELIKQPSEELSILADFSGEKMMVPHSELYQLETLGNYVILYSKKGKGIIRSSLKRILKELDLNLWIQISRRHWVARKDILSWSRGSNGRLTLTLYDEIKVIVSRRHTPRVIASIAPPEKIIKA